MDKHEKQTEDLLSHYINPEKIEKAPEGFTSKVMSVIETEKITLRTAEKNKKRSLVPYIFALFIFLLTILTFFLPVSKNHVISITIMEFFEGIKVKMPVVDFGNIFSIDLPSALMYGLIGILLLSFLDRALYRAFHRE